MKTSTPKLLLALCINTMFLISCSENEPISELVKTENKSSDIGRFENIPFKWDYTYSTDSASQAYNKNQVYIGDLMQITTDTSTINTRSYTTHRTSYGNREGEERRRIGGGERRKGENGNRYRKEDIFISNPIPVYLGAAYPEKEFGKSFKPEILYPRNPIDVIFNFTIPYIGEVTKANGSIGYKKLLGEALNSNEYKSHINKGTKESFDFMCSEYYSYSDIEKAFSGNTGLAKFFSSKIQNNTHSINAKSKLLGQLISKNFTVSMDIPVNGFFKDKTNDTAQENPVYVYSITYGKVALLSVESEYSFEEVKTAIEAGINYKIFSASGNYSKKSQEIIAKSKITLFIISDDDPNGHVFYTIDNIKSAFNLSYSEYNPGYPVFCQGNYTKDNSAFYLDYDKTYVSHRGVSTRPSNRN